MNYLPTHVIELLLKYKQIFDDNARLRYSGNQEEAKKAVRDLLRILREYSQSLLLMDYMEPDEDDEKAVYSHILGKYYPITIYEYVERSKKNLPAFVLKIYNESIADHDKQSQLP